MTESAFSTSGHTGTPVRWMRTPEQLRAEVELVTAEVLGQIDHVVCFAPPEHLFGRLYGEVLPRLRGVEVEPLWADQFAVPRLRPGKRTLFVCLPASWLRLRAVTDRIAQLPGAVALHGTGPTVPATERVARALAGTAFRTVEVFGSTETGAVAVRAFDVSRPSAEWHLLADVEAVADPGMPEQLLRVRSSRLARREDMTEPPDTWELSDLVRFRGDRRFELVGRTSRLVKINGVRCDLARVEQLLKDRWCGLDLACVPVTDDVRAEHYELFYAGAGMSAEHLQSGLAAALRGWPMPRAIRRVVEIPRSATGKVQVRRLRTLAGVS